MGTPPRATQGPAHRTGKVGSTHALPLPCQPHLTPSQSRPDGIGPRVVPIGNHSPGQSQPGNPARGPVSVKGPDGLGSLPGPPSGDTHIYSSPARCPGPQKAAGALGTPDRRQHGPQGSAQSQASCKLGQRGPSGPRWPQCCRGGAELPNHNLLGTLPIAAALCRGACLALPPQAFPLGTPCRR